MVSTSWSKKKRKSISLEQKFSEVVACFKKEAGLKTAMELSRGSQSKATNADASGLFGMRV